MKKNRFTFMIISVLFMAAIWGFIAIEKGTNILNGIDIYIFILIIVLGVVALFRALKKEKEEKAGLAIEDELTTKLKYKSGYYAYLSSMYMWLFIFLFKDKFPDIETMLGGGILLSGLIGYIAKIYVKHNFNE